MSAKVSRSTGRSFRWTPGILIGLVIMAALVLTAIVAPLMLSSAADTLTANASQPPSADHLLGTDGFGRDVLARSLVATRLTLLMTVATTVIAVGAGIVIGTGVWLAPRIVREGALRIIEAAVAYPSLIFALIIAAILGQGVFSAVLAVAISGVPAFARLTANMAATVSARDYVTMARLQGVTGPRIISRHLIPNIAEPLLVLTATVFATTLTNLSSLSFVGLGVQSPDYDFGRLLNDGLFNIYSQPMQAVGPALMITLAGLSSMLIGDGLAASTDPRGGRRFSTKRQAAPKLSASSQDAGNGFVVVKNLKVTSSAGAPLVNGVSFAIREGEILGLVGESGSGKSLTAMSIAGLLPPELTVTADRLSVGEHDLLGRVSPRTLATTIGLVYQDPGTTFNPALRMGGQLTEVSRVHLKMSKKEADDRMVKALDDIHVSQPRRRLRQHPHELSGGMLQRAKTASSLVTDPRLIIADEPTTALDVTVQAGVLRQFKAINRERGTSMLFISHDLGVVQALCDRVLVMKSGEVVEELGAGQLASGEVSHPYTKKLLAAVPSRAHRTVHELTHTAASLPMAPAASEEARP